MPTLTGVQIRPSDKVQYFDANDLSLTVGERVIVETWDGDQEGVVVIAPDQVLRSDLRGPLNPVLRKVIPE
jgi:cell fate regulator YaaT (PSP1 superfamily)